MFNQKRNKQFSYKARFQDLKEEASKERFESKLSHAKDVSKKRGKSFTSLPVLLLVLLLICALLYILEGYNK